MIEEELVIDKIKPRMRIQADEVLASVPVGLVMLNTKGQVAWLNAQASGMLGGNIAGKQWIEVIAQAFSPKADDGHEVSLVDGRQVHVAISALRRTSGQLVTLIDMTVSRRYEQAKAEHKRMNAQMPTVQGNEPIAQDPKSQALMSMALKVAQSEVGVMISGESGTGKEVLAHFIHDHSSRRGKAFIAINCAAIPEQMLEATLFGYEKGAFTGAYKSTPGKFEQAQGGTLLLDEVSEMSLSLQAKLLRVLQEKEVERIGSNKLIALDVRVLATSNRNLQDEVNAGRFREDLYYRLNVFPLHWLPLRERPSDILPLADYLIRRHCRKDCTVLPTISPAAQDALLNYPWPGNARELDNVVQRAMVLQTQNCIEPEHLHLPEAEKNSAQQSLATKNCNLEQHEYDFIEQVIQQSENRRNVASILGISERTLRYKLSRMREKGYAV